MEKNNFDYQGKSQKQYENNAKIVFISMIIMGIIIIGALFNTKLI